MTMEWLKRDNTPESLWDAVDEQGVRYVRNAAGTEYTVIVPHAMRKLSGKGSAVTLAEARRLADKNLHAMEEL